jgi:hypothetical protein
MAVPPPPRVPRATTVRASKPMPSPASVHLHEYVGIGLSVESLYRERNGAGRRRAERKGKECGKYEPENGDRSFHSDRSSAPVQNGNESVHGSTRTLSTRLKYNQVWRQRLNLVRGRTEIRSAKAVTPSVFVICSDGLVTCLGGLLPQEYEDEVQDEDYDKKRSQKPQEHLLSAFGLGVAVAAVSM